MRRLQRIGVGTNFSPEADLALSAAAMLARAGRTEVDVVHVVQRPPLYERMLHAEGALLAQLEQQALAQLQARTATPAFAGLRVSHHTRVGAPFAELIALTRDQQHDLLVLGARRRHGLGDLLLGSTTERVLRKAATPVLVAKSALADPPRCVLAATDFSTAARPALDEAVALARRWQARLVLLHVIEPVVQAYAWASDLAGGEIYVVEPEELQPEWDALLAGLPLDGVTPDVRTIKGDVASTVAALAADLPADLVVIGTHGRTGLSHALLGSVAEGVARAVDRSVLIVRAGIEPVTLPE